MKVLAYLFHLFLGTLFPAVVARRQAAIGMCLVAPSWSRRVRSTQRFREHREGIERQVQPSVSLFEVSGLCLRGSTAR